MSSPNNFRHIAIYLPNLAGGGAERVMVNLAEGFCERGYHVDMVLAKAQGPYLKSLSKEINVIDLDAKSVFFSLAALVNYLKENKPKTLYTALGHTNIIAVLAKKLARVSTAVVISVHNVTPPYLRTFSKENLLQRFYPVFYKQADAVVAVAKGVAEDIAKKANLAAKDVTVIYNPVVTPIMFEKARAEVPHKWFEAGQPPVILGIGRLTEQKDFPTLISAFALLRKQQQAHLLILGEGEDRPSLERLAKSLGVEQDVYLPGFVDNPYAYLAKANAFVLSSIYEGLPTVLIEALALGTPVVSTNCMSGPSEILEEGKYGAIVPMKDIEALANAMAQTLALPRKAAIKEAYHPYLREVATDNYLRVAGLV
jgi:glycosyltransferase involved in cell wall biosynthesis